MPSIEGLKNKLNEYKPTVVSAFVVYVTPRESPIDPDSIDPEFEIVEVNTPDDPILPKICANKRQLKIAQKAMRDGRWNVIVALNADKEPVGRIWETRATETALANGVPRMKLAADEFLMFDLWVDKPYRRGGLANTMADFFFRRDPPDTTTMTNGYGFVSYENIPSILWHHSVGFQIAQTMNYLQIGPFIKWKMPFSDMPRFGPMSRKGRHNDPSKPIFGPPLFP
ncbi:MAG TPA: hypothetical protein PLV93_07930 [Microthrixaceae bacterium]|nr:hypothetical protein [Microthrixaceae bacterium]HNI35314.1 hypothetical protein [Microthrixaceae bacterium]